jgi:hypothetical protein
MERQMVEFTGDKIERMDGWSRNCRVSGVDYSVSVRRGKSVRIPYKPRGQNRGWHWHGAVYQNGQCLWSDRVPGSIGVRGLLLEAGVLTEGQAA